MNSIDKQYQDLLQDILDRGVKKQDRTGTGTISVFGRHIRHDMKDGFPLLTTKKMAWKNMVTELLWFLRGDTNIKYLVDNGCHIWDGDAYKNYLKYAGNNPLSKDEFIERIKTDYDFAGVYGELGPIYGKQWRSWASKSKELSIDSENYMEFKTIDQIADVIHKLKTNPDDRGIIVSAWNVGELYRMVLRPCHNFFQFYTRELSDAEQAKIYWNRRGITEPMLPALRKDIESDNIPTRAVSLMWNQRSVDTFLGLPFNIASYGLLLEIIGRMVNMVPDELIGNLGDTHLYLNHIDQANEQIGRSYTPAERFDLLKSAMGEEAYKNAVDDMVPFGGGFSEYYDMYKIPYKTREPLELPKLVMGKTDAFFESLSEDLTLFGHLDPIDFRIENYKFHPAIKAPLSN